MTSLGHTAAVWRAVLPWATVREHVVLLTCSRGARELVLANRVRLYPGDPVPPPHGSLRVSNRYAFVVTLSMTNQERVYVSVCMSSLAAALDKTARIVSNEEIECEVRLHGVAVVFDGGVSWLITSPRGIVPGSDCDECLSAAAARAFLIRRCQPHAAAWELRSPTELEALALARALRRQTGVAQPDEPTPKKKAGGRRGGALDKGDEAGERSDEGEEDEADDEEEEAGDSDYEDDAKEEEEEDDGDESTVAAPDAVAPSAWLPAPTGTGFRVRLKRCGEQRREPSFVGVSDWPHPVESCSSEDSAAGLANTKADAFELPAIVGQHLEAYQGAW